MMDGHGTHRRRIAGLVLLACLAAVGLLMGWLLLSSAGREEPMTVTVGLPNGEVAASFIVSVDGGEVRGWIVRQPDGQIRAFVARDTYLGCTVPFRPRDLIRPREATIPAGQAGAFKDPCHGSVYSMTGEVLEGPAPRDLDQFDINDGRGEQVTVQVSRVRLGQCRSSKTPSATCSPPGSARYVDVETYSR